MRCPRHRSKFAGGLWYSLETGASLTLGPTVTPPVPPVVALACRFEGAVSVCPDVLSLTRTRLDAAPPRAGVPRGHIWCERRKREGFRHVTRPGHQSRAHAARKFQIRVQKVAKALTCGCVAPTPAKEFAPLTGHVWDVTSVANVSHDCILVHLACAAGVLLVGDITNAHLWHVSLRLDVDKELVERDYTPVSSLEEYRQVILPRG